MDDKRLERLYDYTKFHIGIYLSAAGGLAALISTAAEGSSQQTYISSLIGSPWALFWSFAFMVGAGIAGAVVATSAIESESYDNFLTRKQGAYGLKPFFGKRWVTIEHACFWISLGFLGYGVFSAKAIAGYAVAQEMRASTAGKCPEGDPWTLAPKGRQHIVQNEQEPIRARVCYCEGGEKGVVVNVVTIDDRAPGKKPPTAKSPADKGGSPKPAGTNWRVLALGSCGDYSGQEIYVHNGNAFHIGGTYLIRPRDKGK